RDGDRTHGGRFRARHRNTRNCLDQGQQPAGRLDRRPRKSHGFDPECRRAALRPRARCSLRRPHDWRRHRHGGRASPAPGPEGPLARAGAVVMGFNLSEWALNNRSLTVYLMIVAVVAGLFAFVKLGRNEDPSFVIKTMVVQAAWPGASVDDMLKQVTERLERTLQETPKLDFLRSFTRAGVTTIFVNLKDSTGARE